MNSTKCLYLNARDDFYRLNINNIVFFEGNGNLTTFTLANGQKGVVNINLAGMVDYLSKSLGDDAQMFARVGKRFIINLSSVFHIAIQRQKLFLSDGKTYAYALPISKEALKRLKELFVLSTVNGK